MSKKSVRLRWQLVDASVNKARWYSVTTAADLWGNLLLIKRWGRLNRRGCQERFEWHEDEESIVAEIRRTTARRLKHGYVPTALG